MSQNVLRCSACNAVASADCWTGTTHTYVRWLFDVPHGMMPHVLRYLALFRVPGFDLPHLLGIELLSELVPVMETGTLQFEGQTHTIPVACWQAAFNQMHKQRLTIRNITSHVFLWRVVIGLARDFDAAAEAEREANRNAKTRPVPDKLVIDEVYELTELRAAELRLADMHNPDSGEDIAERHKISEFKKMHLQRAAELAERIAALKAAA